MSTPEGRVKAKLKRHLDNNFGADSWRFMPVQTGYGKPAHDFILCFRGHFISVETKTDDLDSELTALQKQTRAEIIEAGGLVFCVYNEVTLYEFITAISKLEWIHGRPERPAKIPVQAKDKREREQHMRPE